MAKQVSEYVEDMIALRDILNYVINVGESTAGEKTRYDAVFNAITDVHQHHRLVFGSWFQYYDSDSSYHADVMNVVEAAKKALEQVEILLEANGVE